MTSKEKIVEIINKYLYKFDVDKVADEFLAEFEKDLEILEIFKSLGLELQTTMVGSSLFFVIGLKSALLTVEQYTKLKEWSEKNGLDTSHRKLDDKELEILHKVYSFKWE